MFLTKVNWPRERVEILIGEKRGREVIYRHPALLGVLNA